jgi:hypothetical protein
MKEIEIKSDRPQSKKKLVIQGGLGFVIVDEQGNEDRIYIATKRKIQRIINFLKKYMVT